MSLSDRWRRLRGVDVGDEESADAETARLLERARALPRETEPARDLWSGIENRIAAVAGAEPESAPPRGRLTSLFPRPGLATALGVFLVVATAVTTLQISDPRPPSDAEVRVIADRLRQRHGVDQIHQSLLDLLEARRGDLPAETVVALEENLQAIDRAIAEIHLALEANPENHSLSFLLAEAYRREGELLARLEWWTRAPEEGRS